MTLRRYCIYLCGLLYLVASVLAGCVQGAPKNSLKLVADAPLVLAARATLAPRTTIALVTKTLTNAVFAEMQNGARRAEAELGVHLITRSGSQETSVDQQITIVEELIQMRVQAIVITPVGSTELVPVLAKAQQAGIKVVNINNRLDPDASRVHGLKGVPYVSVNNEEAAYQSAKTLSGRLNGPAEVAIVEGIRKTASSEDRDAGALRAFAENSQLKVVAMESANWKIDEAYQVASRAFARYPGIRGVFCANDMMAFGVIKYLSDSGRENVLVAGFDALDEARKAIEDGTLLVSIDQQADQQGYLGVKYAWRMLRGEALPPETLIDATVVKR